MATPGPFTADAMKAFVDGFQVPSAWVKLCYNKLVYMGFIGYYGGSE